RLADSPAPVRRPDDDVGNARVERPVATGAGEADLLAVDQRDCADRICECLAVDLVAAAPAPVGVAQELQGAREIHAGGVEGDFHASSGLGTGWWWDSAGRARSSFP